jgi:hypothetical protein
MSLSFLTATIFDTAVYMLFMFIKFVPWMVIKGLMYILQSASLHDNFVMRVAEDVLRGSKL